MPHPEVLGYTVIHLRYSAAHLQTIESIIGHLDGSYKNQKVHTVLVFQFICNYIWTVNPKVCTYAQTCFSQVRVPTMQLAMY